MCKHALGAQRQNSVSSEKGINCQRLNKAIREKRVGKGKRGVIVDGRLGLKSSVIRARQSHCTFKSLL